MTYVTKKEMVQVPYYSQEEVRTKVLKPVTKTSYEPYTVYVDMPQQVVQRTPLTYVDPFSSGISQGYSSFSPPSSTSIYSSPIEYGPTTTIQPYSAGKAAVDRAPEVSQPAEDDLDLVQPGSAMSEEPETPLERVQRKLVPAESGIDPDDTSPMNAPEIDLSSPSDSAGEDDLLDLLPAPSASDKASARRQSRILPTGFRMRWNPADGREI